MSRDHRKLQVFQLARELAVAVYKATSNFPPEERFGLQSQLRRGAVSVAANIVEGCARRTSGEYIHFLNIALGSSAEVGFLVELAGELGFLETPAASNLLAVTNHLVPALKGLIAALESAELSKSRKPKAKSPV
ncbi:MAG TPA: four helix bundle protein [Holophagaceae bacterium]|nr:four helix bundle protein [Holophagaceae bacterium]